MTAVGIKGTREMKPNRQRNISIFLLVSAMSAPVCFGQGDAKVLRLACGGRSLTSSIGYGAQPDKAGPVSATFVINVETGVAYASGFVPLSRVISRNAVASISSSSPMTPTCGAKRAKAKQIL